MKTVKDKRRRYSILTSDLGIGSYELGMNNDRSRENDVSTVNWGTEN